MAGHKFYPNHMISGELTGCPAAINITRIKHTISALRKSEYNIRSRLRKVESCPEELIYRDLYQHAMGLHWGWDELIKQIEEISDECIDKSAWLAECRMGFTASSQLIIQTRQYFQKRL